MPHSYSYGGGELNSELQQQQQRQNFYGPDGGSSGGGGGGTGNPITSNSTVQYDSSVVDNVQNNSNNNQNSEQDKDGSRNTPYSFHGVLHYLQHQWGEFENDRYKWDMERAELRARISFLMGERKSQENLKHDLVRRIKMLEYSLRQERAKVHRLTHNGQEPESMDEVNEDFSNNDILFSSNVPMDIDAIDKNDQKAANSQTWREARELLKQYLQEIGYSERILDIRSFRVKNLLGILPNNNWNTNNDSRKATEKALLDSEQAILETADIIKQTRKYDNISENMDNNVVGLSGDEDSDSDCDDKALLDVDAVEALGEFSFLKDEKIKFNNKKQQQQQQSINQINNNNNNRNNNEKIIQNELFQRNQQQKSSSASNNAEWFDQTALDQVKEKFRTLNEDRKKNLGGRSNSSILPKDKSSIADKTDSIGFEPLSQLSTNSGPPSQRKLDVDSALGLVTDDVDIKDDFATVDEDSMLANQQRWNIRYTLRSHYDAVRAMQFHPVEPVLITASEDGTAKLWDLNASNSGSLTSNKNLDQKSAQNSQPATGIVDVEPIYTFRGHKGPILAMDMSPTGEMCYTGGYDGDLCCWMVPSTGIEVYSNYNSNVLQERLKGHTDCVWAVAFHSSTNRLISASADGTIRLWEPGVAEGMQSLLRTFAPPQMPNNFNSEAILRPRSIDIVSTEPHQLLTAYSKAQCSILDLETGRNVLTFDFKEGGVAAGDETFGEINKILSHPTMPVTVMAGDDRKIRYFDNNTGKLIHGTFAHVESISTLAIDPNGLYLLSGSHDGSLRLWNMEKRICLQEIAAHRKKHGASVHAVAFHPSRPLIGSAGADSLTKIFATVRNSTSTSPFNHPTINLPTTTSTNLAAITNLSNQTILSSSSTSSSSATTTTTLSPSLTTTTTTNT